MPFTGSQYTLTFGMTIITSNDLSFGCPIIYMDTNSHCYFAAPYNKDHWLTRRPYLAIIASSVLGQDLEVAMSKFRNLL